MQFCFLRLASEAERNWVSDVVEEFQVSKVKQKEEYRFRNLIELSWHCPQKFLEECFSMQGQLDK